MLATKIALAIKNHLINLAVDNKLPLDMTQLDEFALSEVIQTEMNSVDNRNEKAYENAGHYLCDNELSIKEMVDAIVKHPNEDDFIDNVEGVIVWEKVTYTFDCGEFLELINYNF